MDVNIILYQLLSTCTGIIYDQHAILGVEFHFFFFFFFVEQGITAYVNHIYYAM